MSEETAAFWLDVLAAIMGLFWLLGALFVMQSASKFARREHGETNLDQPPETFVERARELLLRGVANSPLSRLKLREAGPSALAWEGKLGGFRHTGSLRASGSSNRTRAVWELESQSVLITVARWVVAFGALGTAVLYYLLMEYVAFSDNPGVRYQIFQMLQASHLLWPPFLFAGLARSFKTRLVTDLDRALNNLQFERAA